jgi:hypothetical protein
VCGPHHSTPRDVDVVSPGDRAPPETERDKSGPYADWTSLRSSLLSPRKNPTHAPQSILPPSGWLLPKSHPQKTTVALVYLLRASIKPSLQRRYRAYDPRQEGCNEKENNTLILFHLLEVLLEG